MTSSSLPPSFEMVFFGTLSGLSIFICESSDQFWLSCVCLVPACIGISRCEQVKPCCILAVAIAAVWAIPKLHWMWECCSFAVKEPGFAWLFLTLGIAAGLALSLLLLWYFHSYGCLFCIALPTAWLFWEECTDAFLRIGLWTTADIIRLPQTQYGDTPLLQVCSLGGISLVTWVICALNGLFADAARLFLSRKHWPLNSDESVQITSAVMLTGVILTACTVGKTEDRDQEIVALVGVDVEQLRHDSFRELLQSHAVDVVLFPENSTVEWLHPGMRSMQNLADSANTQASVIVGGKRLDDEGRAFVSALMVRSGQRIQYADKRFPAPISDCQPPLARFGGIPARFAGQFADGPQYLTISDHIRVGTGICHDVCFAEWGRSYYPNPPCCFVNLGSESFTSSSQLKRRILNCVRWRAIETRRCIVRSVRSGTSGLIDDRGSVRSVQTPSLKPFRVRIDSEKSVFSSVGRWASHLIWGASLAGCVIVRYREVRCDCASRLAE
ncbi:MAG: hypothetical protein H8E37_07815 [Planctomycetes bacterium]|nr:hypothetical protein [Planctomycetota bacterium]